MRRITVSLLCTVLLLTVSGCNSIIQSMDRNNIDYAGKTYTRISQQWEMNSSEKYTVESIANDNVSLRIRTYDDDSNGDFIYIENDGLLFHNNAAKFPENNVHEIHYLLLRFHDKTYELMLDDDSLINEFVRLISDIPQKSVDANKNIASLIIYYKNYPACFFFGNIIIDRQGDYWIELAEANNGYLKLTSDSKLLSNLKSET